MSQPRPYPPRAAGPNGPPAGPSYPPQQYPSGQQYYPPYPQQQPPYPPQRYPLPTFSPAPAPPPAKGRGGRAALVLAVLTGLALVGGVAKAAVGNDPAVPAEASSQPGATSAPSTGKPGGTTTPAPSPTPSPSPSPTDAVISDVVLSTLDGYGEQGFGAQVSLDDFGTLVAGDKAAGAKVASQVGWKDGYERDFGHADDAWQLGIAGLDFATDAGAEKLWRAQASGYNPAVTKPLAIAGLPGARGVQVTKPDKAGEYFQLVPLHQGKRVFVLVITGKTLPGVAEVTRIATLQNAMSATTQPRYDGVGPGDSAGDQPTQTT